MNVGEEVEVVLLEAQMSCLTDGFAWEDWERRVSYEHNINLVGL